MTLGLSTRGYLCRGRGVRLPRSAGPGAITAVTRDKVAAVTLRSVSVAVPTPAPTVPAKPSAPTVQAFVPSSVTVSVQSVAAPSVPSLPANPPSLTVTTVPDKIVILSK